MSRKKIFSFRDKTLKKITSNKKGHVLLRKHNKKYIVSLSPSGPLGVRGQTRSNIQIQLVIQGIQLTRVIHCFPTIPYTPPIEFLISGARDKTKKKSNYIFLRVFVSMIVVFRF